MANTLGGAIHVFVAEPFTQVDAVTLARCAAVLQAKEHTRARRHARSGQYQRTVLSRFMARDVLSGFVPAVAPGDWMFAVGQHGKPEVAWPQGAPHFNVSHTRDRIVMCVSSEPCGIDIESDARKGRLMEVAERFLAASESAALRALDGEAARRRFLATWTLKEAFVKALGRGLSFELLKQFAFDLDELSLSITAAADVPRAWQVWQLEPDPGYLVGVAVAGGLERDLKLWRYCFDASPPLAERVVPLGFFNT